MSFLQTGILHEAKSGLGAKWFWIQNSFLLSDINEWSFFFSLSALRQTQDHGGCRLLLNCVQWTHLHTPLPCELWPCNLLYIIKSAKVYCATFKDRPKGFGSVCIFFMGRFNVRTKLPCWKPKADVWRTV